MDTSDSAVERLEDLKLKLAGIHDALANTGVQLIMQGNFLNQHAAHAVNALCVIAILLALILWRQW